MAETVERESEKPLEGTTDKQIEICLGNYSDAINKSPVLTDNTDPKFLLDEVMKSITGIFNINNY